MDVREAAEAHVAQESDDDRFPSTCNDWWRTYAASRCLT